MLKRHEVEILLKAGHPNHPSVTAICDLARFSTLRRITGDVATMSDLYDNRGVSKGRRNFFEFSYCRVLRH